MEMDRDKYKTDESYREGYLIGRKDAINIAMTNLQYVMDNLKHEINYCETLLEKNTNYKKEE